jgi:hypothetical protein
MWNVRCEPWASPGDQPLVEPAHAERKQTEACKGSLNDTSRHHDLLFRGFPIEAPKI